MTRFPTALRGLGATVQLLDADELAWGDLNRYDAIFIGVRAYDSREDLRANNKRVLDYASAGGTVVVQYNRGSSWTQYAPFPARFSNTRVTDENGQVQVLASDDPAFHYPNEIGAGAWANWVQERGTYFIVPGDQRYTDLIQIHEPFEHNEGWKKGALVTANVGKGRWIFVGLGSVAAGHRRHRRRLPAARESRQSRKASGKVDVSSIPILNLPASNPPMREIIPYPSAVSRSSFHGSRPSGSTPSPSRGLRHHRCRSGGVQPARCRRHAGRARGLTTRTPDDVDASIGQPGYAAVTPSAGASEPFSPSSAINDARQRWLFRMVHSRRPLQEKMALFWHQHFATAYSKVANAAGGGAVATQMMAAKASEHPAGLRGQIELFRDYALPNFRDLLYEVARDPAMLFWLDGRLNTKARPQENFAREVMELFTMGVGQFTEEDVYAGARVFTGWNLQRIGDARDPLGFYQFFYNGAQHDTSAKTFSFPIYTDGSKTIPARAESGGMQDGVDLLNALARHPETARRLARKLWSFFISEIRPPDEAFVARIANVYALSDCHMSPVVRAVLTSQEFDAPDSYFREILVARRVRGARAEGNRLRGISAQQPRSDRSRTWASSCSSRRTSPDGSGARRGSRPRRCSRE